VGSAQPGAVARRHRWTGEHLQRGGIGRRGGGCRWLLDRQHKPRPQGLSSPRSLLPASQTPGRGRDFPTPARPWVGQVPSLSRWRRWWGAGHRAECGSDELDRDQHHRVQLPHRVAHGGDTTKRPRISTGWPVRPSPTWWWSSSAPTVRCRSSTPPDRRRDRRRLELVLVSDA